MRHQHFKLATYYVVQYLVKLKGMDQLAADYEKLARHLDLEKVYLETFRSGLAIDEAKMREIKQFFLDRGIEVAGGITTTLPNPFPPNAMCYTNEENRDLIKRVAEMTASLFDEFILDDFFFTNCKCPSCIAAKGDRSWAEFRTELLRDVSANLIVGPAKKINPRVKTVIKYPNWYDHYHCTGYNLEDEPGIFDGIYTGTETRDPERSQQTLPAYLSYSVLRYLENVKPGGNGGGWFDPFDVGSDLALFVHQVDLTLFAKAKEMTLFCAPALVDTIFPPIAAYALEKADAFLDQLGEPVGIPCYKPYHSSGEEYLLDYLGMLGLPLEPTPRFPEQAGMILLTATAAKDPEIISKMKAHLLAGHDICITSGLLKELTGRGIEDFIICRDTGAKVATDRFAHETIRCAFKHYHNSSQPVLFPHLEYATNDSWPLIVGFGEHSRLPVFLKTPYGRGLLYLLTIPDDPGELYRLPREILKPLRDILMHDLSLTMDAESRVNLFLYDNDTFIVQSCLPYNTEVRITVKRPGVGLVDLESGKRLAGAGEGGNESAVTKKPVGLLDLESNKRLAGAAGDGGDEFVLNLAPNVYQVLKMA